MNNFSAMRIELRPVTSYEECYHLNYPGNIYVIQNAGLDALKKFVKEKIESSNSASPQILGFQNTGIWHFVSEF